ncbi:MAG: L,D-transpeptidase [Bacteroidota bacterium]|nr:L,D-transpeptidase [Bacteroidota bacterium]
MEEQSENLTENAAGGSPSSFRRYLDKAAEFVKTHRWARTTLISLAILLLVLFIFSIPVYIGPAIQHSWGTSRAECRPDSALLENRAIRRQISATRNEITRLERRLASYVPTQTYLVINTVDNRFSLYRNRQLIREGYCSSGSYVLLKTEEGDKEWIFKTPRGRLSIQGKITNPVWRKPDWAFIEEGLPVPGASDPSRYEFGVLGKYAMSLGDGYLIHGTLYQRQLGMPVTHGCIRLGDEDLEAVFSSLSVGSRVYIY